MALSGAERSRRYRQRNHERLLIKERQHREANREKIRAANLRYRERHRAEVLGRGATYRDEHREEIRVRQRIHAHMRLQRSGEQVRRLRREANQRLRIEVLTHYGAHCECCHESNLKFLGIDHIYGGGSAHRRQMKLRAGSGFYRWLKRNSFPSGFQVLCHNCNLAKGFYGECPHVEQRRNAAPFAPKMETDVTISTSYMQ